jgi:hypothetical protein
MGTFIFDLASNVDIRIHEVDTLIEKAQNEPDGSDLFNALCRSSIVLTVAHLEGFIKDCAKALIDDINTFGHFYDVPDPIKRTFCLLYLGNPEKNNGKNFEGHFD